MGFFTDEKKERSMMRLLSFMIVTAGLLWGTIEVVLHFFKPEYDVHETLILGAISIGVTGKGAQKAIEALKTKME